MAAVVLVDMSEDLPVSGTVGIGPNLSALAEITEAVQGGAVRLVAYRVGQHEFPDLPGTGRATPQQVSHDGEALLAQRSARYESLQGLIPGVIHGVLPAALQGSMHYDWSVREGTSISNTKNPG